jgi:hypothetical protein
MDEMGLSVGKKFFLNGLEIIVISRIHEMGNRQTTQTTGCDTDCGCCRGHPAQQCCAPCKVIEMADMVSDAMTSDQIFAALLERHTEDDDALEEGLEDEAPEEAVSVEVVET